jgi:predicted dehydrogenase
MHFRYHPLAARIRQIAGSDLGPVERLEVRISFPVFRSSNSRYHYELGGGALMDQGCYAVSLIRLVAGGELKVTAAEARLASPKVDRWMRAELKLPGGGAAHLICSIWSAEVFRCSLYVKGLNGEMRVSNPVAPHLFHRLKWKASGAGQREQIKNCQSTYYYQLKAFAEAASGMSTLATGADEAEANLRVIDAIYRRAGLPIRGETQ